MLVEDNAIEEEIELADVSCERLQLSVCGVEQLISSKFSPTTYLHPSTLPLPPPDSSSKTADHEVPSASPISGRIPSPKSTDTSESRIKLPKLTIKT